jgi:hypothetical protein
LEDASLDDLFCVVCSDRRKNCVLLDCQHAFTCTLCAENLKECPMCRASIRIRMKIYN